MHKVIHDINNSAHLKYKHGIIRGDPPMETEILNDNYAYKL